TRVKPSQSYSELGYSTLNCKFAKPQSKIPTYNVLFALGTPSTRIINSYIPGCSDLFSAYTSNSATNGFVTLIDFDPPGKSAALLRLTRVLLASIYFTYRKSLSAFSILYSTV